MEEVEQGEDFHSIIRWRTKSRKRRLHDVETTGQREGAATLNTEGSESYVLQGPHPGRYGQVKKKYHDILRTGARAVPQRSGSS